ncbi:glycosyltransferase family A protein [Mucilaginibacter ginsenosidivorans]|uniref:Glycosyltransferase family 2 protein n=1 Tax=Mucilaginibacter ginsenosidivorans TaxID=398053 RepID=A0A5B8UU62_9SPHI|nr:glycosyltransferase family A protein [Mucilaginibacter ginsenosidivorans]QEC62428.1 glycosyltransferase family 2 protein [Mucilaginibacter ginsenosidivorans]
MYPDLTCHPQYFYAQNPETFKRARLSYYTSKKKIDQSFVRKLFLDEYRSRFLDQYFHKLNLEKLKNIKADIIIITATFNRAHTIEKLFLSIINQKFPGNICWIIIDNGSTDATAQLLASYQTDLNIIYLKYSAPFGYASPSRNRGLAFAYAFLKKQTGLKYYWVIDSDDYIHNEYVLKNLYTISRRHRSVITHGFAVTNYEDNNGIIITQNTIPREINSAFPMVPTLKDEFETGPQNLAAIVDCNFLPYFYYPDEFTMEDDALNQRIMAYCFKRKLKIIALDTPCLVKTFHLNSMSGSNNTIGNQDLMMGVGPMTVKGVRAQVVIGLLHLRDYFTRQSV